MPKPTTYQRPIPVHRNWSGGRPGMAPPPFGKHGKKIPRPAPGAARSGLELDLKLPKPLLPRT